MVWVWMFGLFLAAGLTAYYLNDMIQKRAVLLELLPRIEPLVKGQGKIRIRNLRTVALSMFSAPKLMAGLAREVTELERLHELVVPEPPRGLALPENKRLAFLELRVEAIEVQLGAKSERSAGANGQQFTGAEGGEELGGGAD